MRIALVYNPRLAGQRQARVAALARMLDARGHAVTHHHAETFRAGRDAADAQLVCICGGDGTARLVIAAQDDPAALPPIAVFPVGTVNLLARELDYPADPRQFALRIESGREPVASRLAAINGRAFLCCVSVGADAHAVAALSLPLKDRIGRLAYGVAMARAMARWQRRTMRVECGGSAFAAEALFVLRGHFYAGPWTLDRAAGLAGDELRIIALPRARRRDLAAFALYALTGARRPGRDWRMLGARQVTVSAADPVAVQVDGDAGGATPLAIAMTGASLRFA